MLNLAVKCSNYTIQLQQCFSSEVALSMQTVQSKYEELKANLEEKFLAQKEIEKEISSNKSAKDAKCRFISSFV